MQPFCKMLWIFIFTVFITNSSFSNTYRNATITVGKQPAYVFGENYFYWVFCNGYDANYDGIYDEDTDEAPSLWLVTYEQSIASDQEVPFTVDKVHEFEFGFTGFPFRPVLQDGYLYFYLNGAVRKFDVLLCTEVDSYELENSTSGLEISGNLLYAATRVIPPGAWTAEDNYVLVYDMNTKTIVDTIPALMNVQKVQVINNDRILVLNEGFGAEDSYVNMHQLNWEGDDKFPIERAFYAGSTGNHFLTDKNQTNLFIVSNSSHKIFQYSLENENNVLEYTLPTSGYNGPREIVLNEIEGKFRVSAYDGKFYEFNTGTDEIVEIYDGAEKCESMCWNSSPDIFIGTNISKNDYTADETISVWWNDLTSIKDKNIEVAIYPNPAISHINIKTDMDFNYYEIYSIDGSRITSGDISSKQDIYQIDLNRTNIQSGAYYVVLVNDRTSKIIPFTTIK